MVRKGGQKTTKKQSELIDLLRRFPNSSRKEFSNILKINESAVQKRFETLKKKGLIKREGGAKGGYWKILE